MDNIQEIVIEIDNNGYTSENSIGTSKIISKLIKLINEKDKHEIIEELKQYENIDNINKLYT